MDVYCVDLSHSSRGSTYWSSHVISVILDRPERQPWPWCLGLFDYNRWQATQTCFFLTRCRKRRLNQALSVLSLSLGFFSVFCAVHEDHFVLFCIRVCFVSWSGSVVISLPVQVTDWSDLSLKWSTGLMWVMAMLGPNHSVTRMKCFQYIPIL